MSGYAIELLTFDSAQRVSLQAALERAGYRLLEAAAASLLLLDLTGSGDDGWEIVAERAVGSGQQLLLCADLPQQRERALVLGANLVLTSPSVPELLTAVATLASQCSLSEELAQCHRRLRRESALIDHTSLGIAHIDGERHLIRINPHFASLFGYRTDQLLGQSGEQLFPTQDDYLEFGRLAYPRLRAGESFEQERLMRRADGSRFWCLMRGSAVDEQQLDCGYVWQLEETTQLRRDLCDLRLGNTVFQTASEAILVSDHNNHIITINPAFSLITGYSREEVVGKNPHILSSGRHEPGFYTNLWRALKREGRWQGEVWNRRKDGSIYPEWLSISVVRDEGGKVSHHVAVFSDITRRKKVEQMLEKQASYDPLTDLPNRLLFQERLKQTLLQADSAGQMVALLYIDLDDFKQINDSLGHEAGDQVLLTASRILQRSLNEGDSVARIGGDEFVITMLCPGGSIDAHTMARRVTANLVVHVQSGETTLQVSCSVGVAFAPQDAEQADELMRLADQAMYQAKADGRNGYRFHDVKPVTAASPAPLRITESKHDKARLLLVENNSDFARLGRIALEAEGYRVEHAVGVKQALQCLQDEQFDLLLLDYDLGDGTGLDILQQVGEWRLDLPTIMITGHGSETVAIDAMRLGAADYLRKDDNFIRQLASSVASTLEHHQRKSESEVIDGEQLLYSLYNTAQIALLIVDADGQVLEANTPSGTLYGYSHQELVSMHVRALFSSDERELLERVCRANESMTFESLVVGRDGIALEVEVHCGTLIFKGELRTLLVLRDITERKHSEARLKQSSIVFENTAEAVFITDPESRILAVNPAFTHVTGYRETEVLGRPVSLLKSGIHSSSFYSTLWATIQSAGFWQGEITNRRKDGGLFPAWQNITRVCDDQGEVSHYISIFSDITERKISEERIRHLAHHDVLTDLPNRLLFEVRLEHALMMAGHNQRLVALLYLDLDRFKHINNSLGHAEGDELLKEVALRLRQQVGDLCTLARLGGDEFSLILDDISQGQEAAELAVRLLGAFTTPFQIEGHELFLSTSIGIAIYPRDGQSSADLLRHADAALYRAKAHGRNNYQFYTRELTVSAQEQFLLENSLRRAIELDELFIHYQPQIDLESGAVVGCEALLRWQHPELGLVSPERFIGLAEETGLIVPIGEWVLRTACQQVHRWLDLGLQPGVVAVNLSALQLQRGQLVETIKRVLDESGLAPHRLELEITESAVMQDAREGCLLLGGLRELGIGLAIDDFGTGYSSLAYLRTLPLDKLKLDRSFITDLASDESARSLTRAVIALGRALELRVIAEGVEELEQEQFLRQEGCQEVQGFLYARPMLPAQFAQFLRERGQ